jgi:hypothetical protein
MVDPHKYLIAMRHIDYGVKLRWLEPPRHERCAWCLTQLVSTKCCVGYRLIMREDFTGGTVPQWYYKHLKCFTVSGFRFSKQGFSRRWS